MKASDCLLVTAENMSHVYYANGGYVARLLVRRNKWSASMREMTDKAINYKNLLVVVQSLDNKTRPEANIFEDCTWSATEDNDVIVVKVHAQFYEKIQTGLKIDDLRMWA